MYVGTFNPINLLNFDDIRASISLDKNIFPVISIRSHVLKVLKALYGPQDTAQEMAELKEMAESSDTDINIVDDVQVVELENLAKFGETVPA